MEQGTIVIDVPEGATAAEASQALNAPGDSYFLVQVLPLPGAHRAYFRRYKQPAKPEAASASEANDAAVALSIIRANREQPVRALVSLLEAQGIKRGRQWVCDQLTATCAEDGREDEALAILKQYPALAPRDVLDELRYGPGIKRSVGWVRQKRQEVAAASV